MNNSPYLDGPLRSEAEILAEIGTRTAATLDLEKFKTRALASVAYGTAASLLQDLGRNKAEAMDPVTRALIIAKIAIVEDLLDKRDGMFCR